MSWKREYAGRYVSLTENLAIERAAAGGWNVINLTTGRVLDHLDTKRAAMAVYRG